MGEKTHINTVTQPNCKYIDGNYPIGEYQDPESADRVLIRFHNKITMMIHEQFT